MRNISKCKYPVTLEIPWSQLFFIGTARQSTATQMLSSVFHRCLPRFHSQQATAAIHPRCVTSQPQVQLQCIQEQLRELFRGTAQPVAVVTALMPPSSSKIAQPVASTQALHHGATVSSFTPIAMDPYPLVTFALRIPSRMTTALDIAANSASSAPAIDAPAQLVINILSSTQSKHAFMFSRPDLHPTPFADPDIIFKLSEEGLPVLEGSLGALSCRLVGQGIPLHDMESLASVSNYGRTSMNRNDEGGQIAARHKGKQHLAGLKDGIPSSVLFIAQIMRIEASASTAAMPLVYFRQKFTSCAPC